MVATITIATPENIAITTTGITEIAASGAATTAITTAIATAIDRLWFQLAPSGQVSIDQSANSG